MHTTRHILLLSLVYSSLYFHQISYASVRDDALKIARDTLDMVDGKNNLPTTKDNLAKLEQNIAELKEMVQNDLKAGDKTAPVDVYLFTVGVVKDDLTSLQSLLINSSQLNFPQDLSQLMSYSSARKLSYATKENRGAQKTHVYVIPPADKLNCQLYINGEYYEIWQFTVPADVPFYAGVYCADNTFAVQKVQSGETQTELTVRFSGFRSVTFTDKDGTVLNGIPNPNAQSALLGEAMQSKSATSTPPENLPVQQVKQKVALEQKVQVFHPDSALGLGFGVNHGFNFFEDSDVYNISMPRGSFVYGNINYSYKHLILSVDYAQVNYIHDFVYMQDEEISYYKAHYATASYIRPSAGYIMSLWDINGGISVMGSALLDLLFLQNGPDDANFGVGASIAVWPRFILEQDLFFELKPTLSFTTGNIDGAQIGVTAGIGMYL